MAKNSQPFEVTCPCCNALLKIDPETRAVIGHTAAVVPKMFNDLEAAARGLAVSIVANSWHTLRADKRLVNEGQRYTLEEGLAYERRTSPGAGPDMADRLKSFGAKN